MTADPHHGIKRVRMFQLFVFGQKGLHTSGYIWQNNLDQNRFHPEDPACVLIVSADKADLKAAGGLFIPNGADVQE